MLKIRNNNSYWGNWPIVIALVLFLLTVILIRPDGEYPVNDDWVYSWFTKRFAETGRFRIDVESTASVIGQSLIALPFVKLFGFSHVLLRMLTMVVGAILIAVMDGLLNLAKVKGPVRTLSLCIIVLNPLFMNLTLSFMTEIHGFTPAFAGALIWFYSRLKADEENRPALVSWRAALTSAALIAFTFWIRQFCVLVFPAVFFVSLVGALQRKEMSRIKASFWRGTVSALLFVAIIITYFIWAKASQNYNWTFGTAIDAMVKPGFRELCLGFSAYWMYMVAFLYPLLLWAPIKKLFRQTPLKWVFFCLAAELVGLGLFYPQESKLHWPLATPLSFPMLGNVIYSGGVGPLLLIPSSNLEQHGLINFPVLPSIIWRTVSFFIILFMPICFGLLLNTARDTIKKPVTLRSEILLFGTVFSAGLAIVSFEAYKGAFDRYHLPFFLGIILTVAIAIDGLIDRLSKIDFIKVVLACVPLAFYTIAGIHDYFRWNDVRWNLLDEAITLGARKAEVDGGYEMSGWNGRLEPYEIWVRSGPDGKRRFRIATHLAPPGFKVEKVVQIKGWLAPIPPILLMQKDS